MKINYCVYNKDTKEIIYENFDSYQDAMLVASYNPEHVATNADAGLTRFDMIAWLNKGADAGFLCDEEIK